MGIISSQLFHLPGGASEKWAPFVQSRGWQMEISISISRSHENRRDASRIVEKPREASRSHEKTREASSSLERPREVPRRLEKALLGASMNFAKVRYQLYCSYVCLPRLRKLWLRCWGTKPANRSKTRSFFHVIRLYCYPNSVSNISDCCPRLATIYIYITWSFALYWTLKSGDVE